MVVIGPAKMTTMDCDWQIRAPNTELNQPYRQFGQRELLELIIELLSPPHNSIFRDDPAGMALIFGQATALACISWLETCMQMSCLDTY